MHITGLELSFAWLAWGGCAVAAGVQLGRYRLATAALRQLPALRLTAWLTKEEA